MMPRAYLIALVACILCLPSAAPCQEPEVNPGYTLSGIFFATGIGRYSVRDDFISGQNYSGTLPYTEAGWIRFRGDRGFRMALGFRAGGEVENHHLSSTITDFSLDLEYFYRAATFGFFGKPATVYLGPSTGINLYVSDQNIANNNLDLDVSFASLLSVGATSRVLVPLTSRVRAVTGLRMDLLSLGIRIVDLVEEDESPLKILTVLDGTHATWDLGLRFSPHRRLSLGLRYEAQVLRIDAWDYLGAASNSLILSVTVGRSGEGGS